MMVPLMVGTMVVWMALYSVEMMVPLMVGTMVAWKAGCLVAGSVALRVA